MATSKSRANAQRQTLILLVLVAGLAFALFVEPGLLRDRGPAAAPANAVGDQPAAPNTPTVDPTANGSAAIETAPVGADLPDPVLIGTSWNRDAGGVPSEDDPYVGDPFWAERRHQGDPPPPPVVAELVVTIWMGNKVGLRDPATGEDIRTTNGSSLIGPGDTFRFRDREYQMVDVFPSSRSLRIADRETELRTELEVDATGTLRPIRYY